MDVFYFALCACFAAFITIRLEPEAAALPLLTRRLSMGVAVLSLVFLAVSILSIHSPMVGPRAGAVLAALVALAGLALGVAGFLQAGPRPAGDPRLFALATMAAGVSHWVPLAVFASLGLFGALFLALFVRHGARVLEREVRVRWLFPLMAALTIFILTALSAVSEQRSADREMREDLLAQTRLVADAISLTDLDRLDFTLADEHNLVYRRICRQMMAFAQVMGHRSVYSQVFRGGRILFGPESLEPDDPMASRPGTVYERPPFLNHLVFLTAEPMTVGPYRDEYGTFVSALVPVLDRQTRQIRIVIGMDVETPTWEKRVGWARLRPLLFGFLGLLVVFLAQRSLARAATAPGAGPFWVRHAHAFFLFLLGVLTTVYLAQAAGRDEARSRRLTFWQLALSQAERIRESFEGIEEKDLQSLARFFESSLEVTPQEFRSFTREMHQLPYVRAWSFAPRVPFAGLEDHQRQMQARVNPQYAVYRLPGAPPGDLYPQVYLEPFKPNVVMFGFDLASEAAVAEAIRHAEATGTSAISDAFSLLQENGAGLGATIVHPVHLPSATTSGASSGVIVATLRYDVFLSSIVHRLNPPVGDRSKAFIVDLYQTKPAKVPFFLSTTRQGGSPPADPPPGGDANPGARVPLFVLGNSYLLVFEPTPLFSRIFPERAGRVLLLSGLILTLALTLLVGFILSWQRRLRWELERQSAGWRRSEKKFQTLVEKAPMAVIVLIDGAVQYANASALHLLEQPEGESVLGRDFCDFLAAPSRDRVCSLLEGQDGSVASLEVILEVPGGQIPCGLDCVRIQVDRTRGYLLFIRNLTAQIQAQAENEHLQAQLSQARKMETISRLAGGVSHDFNNMLGVILGSADILIDHMEPQDPNRRDVLEIQAAASRASDLMRRLLAFSRRQESFPVIMDLNKKIKGLIGELARQAGEKIELGWEPAETLWLVSLDPSQLDQMLSIVMANAVEAIEDRGKVAIRTCNVVRTRPETGQTHEYVVLSVADTGVGMPPETVAHLFEPFFSTKQPGEHSGLGLAMLHGIVSQNGGFIEVHSHLGEGSRFEIHLPKAFSTGRLSRPLDMSLSASTQLPPAPVPGTETILFVEDEEANLRIGQRILERAGYAVIPASGGRQAIALLERKELVLHTLICDVALQDISARELVEVARGRFPALGVLFVSGYPEDMVIDRGWIPEGQRFLQKPFTGAQLTEAVRSLHGQRAQRHDVVDPE